MTKFKDVEHLLRLAAVFLVGIVIFLVARSQLVPKSFGEYGHYRGNALNEIASRPVKYAGHKACEDCHADIFEAKSTGKHAGVNCEACHGPLANHAADPGSVIPQLPDTKVLCARCHTANIAKPKTFPQVVVADHAGELACNTCHKPHTPSMTEPAETGAKKKS